MTEVDDIVKRALALDIHIPSWVTANQKPLYKIAYLQIKEAPELKGTSSANRTKMIKALMAKHMQDILDKKVNDGKESSEEKEESSQTNRRF